MQERARKLKKYLFIICSFILVAFGQPAWVSWMSYGAAAIGYALLWKALDSDPFRRRLWVAGGWFVCVQMVQLSWLLSIEFQGYYIIAVYCLLSLILGVQFAILTWLLYRVSTKTWLWALGCAGLWTLLEWSRFYFFCGFAFNLVGISLSASPYSLQMASLWGVLGLSFWVVFTNAIGLDWLRCLGDIRKGVFWVAMVFLPYLFGWVQIAYHHGLQEKSSWDSALLVQPGLVPSQKYPMQGRFQDFIAPLEQWERILKEFKKVKEEAVSLIVLPETAVPFGFDLCIYPRQQVISLFYKTWGDVVYRSLPPFEAPYAEARLDSRGESKIFVSNAFICALAAHCLQTPLLIGLDYRDSQGEKNFNSAFLFSSKTDCIVRYDKRVLLPLAEYLPWGFLSGLAKMYGLQEFFSPGQSAVVFHEGLKIAPSICYEELFPSVLREARQSGACLFANLSNDAWYPRSRLAKQHFTHGRVRAVENGVPLLRCCNTGVTCLVDSLGFVVDSLPEEESGSLRVRWHSYQYKTLFSFWGNVPILGISFLFFFLACRVPQMRRLGIKA